MVHTHKPSRARRLAAPLVALSLLLFLAHSAWGQGLASLSKPIYVKWQYKTLGVTNLAPAVDGEKAYLPLSDGSLVSVHLDDGGLAW